MTEQELVDLACSGERPLQVSMSKDGIFFTAGTATIEITEDEAELLWRILPLAAQLPAASRAPRDRSTEYGWRAEVNDRFFQPYLSEWLVCRFFAGRWVVYLIVAALIAALLYTSAPPSTS